MKCRPIGSLTKVYHRIRPDSRRSPGMFSLDRCVPQTEHDVRFARDVCCANDAEHISSLREAAQHHLPVRTYSVLTFQSRTAAEPKDASASGRSSEEIRVFWSYFMLIYHTGRRFSKPFCLNMPFLLRIAFQTGKPGLKSADELSIIYGITECGVDSISRRRCRRRIRTNSPEEDL